MQLWQERSNRMSDQMIVGRSQELGSSLIRQFDEAIFVNRDDCCGTSLYQNANLFLGRQSQSMVSEDFRKEQPTAT